MARKYKALIPSPDAARAAEGWIQVTTEMTEKVGGEPRTKDLSYETFGGDGIDGVVGTPPLDIVRNYGAYVARITAGALAGDKDMLALAIKENDRWVYGVDLGARSGEKSGGDSPVMAVNGRPGFKLDFFSGIMTDKEGKTAATVPLANLLNSINLGRQQAENITAAMPKALEVATEMHLQSKRVIRDSNGNLVVAPTQPDAPATEPAKPEAPAKPNGRSRR